MNNCQTCRWWSSGNTQWGEIYGVKPQRMCELHECSYAESNRKTVDPATVAMAYDNEYGRVDLDGVYTGPLFGCIHHEPKTVEDA